jgi:hypothetical protein
MSEWINRACDFFLKLWKRRRYAPATLFATGALIVALIVLHITVPESFQRLVSLAKFVIHVPTAMLARVTDEQVSRPQSSPKDTQEKLENLAIPFASLHRIPNASHDAFRVVPYAPGVFLLEWKFSAYVVKTWEKKRNSDRQLKETITMSELLPANRKFRFAAIVLKKLPTGLYEGTKLFYHDLEFSEKEWLKAKLVLSPGEILLGTICAPPFTKDSLGHSYGGVLGDMVDAHYLSLEDPSFRSVSLKTLAERYGLLSVKGIFGPFAAMILDPLLENHSILVLQATDSRNVAFLSSATLQN